MISPEHVDGQKPENEHVSSPTEGQQALPASEEKRPWLNTLMRIISVVLALGGSFAFVSQSSIDPFEFNEWLIMLVILVYAAFCAVLYRSMWATLVIPIVLTLGALLPTFLATLSLDFLGLVVLGLVFVTLPALLGALIGGFFGVAWKERWW